MVALTADEVESGAIDPRKISEAVQQIREVGFTLLEGAIPQERIAVVYDRYMKMFERMKKDSHDRLQISHGQKHFQIQPDLDDIFGEPFLIANELALKCMRPVLGDDLKIAYYNSNIAEPGSNYQKVHRDHAQLFGNETEVPSPPFLLVANIMLCDFTEENGSTEVWPGTHRTVDVANGTQIDIELEERAKNWPSVRTNAAAGSIVIRDLRLWHRGTPNSSDQRRAMLSLVYKRNWLRWRAHKSLHASERTISSWPAETQRMFAR
ncbi:phytanoyl-CoA dioxygenase family protein [Mangrovactinospora gilvigrisea]|uniref:phytanoyl-CoA dioxygenase family protein n=1 Tax=Mangrovactinospora gilvigrisea TaxID=1428644 RepID=UPI0008FCDC59|nr:phytanoyl-CoA dioxygenase family protein [Mangrovactinospora gilvigrisea]